MKRLIRQSIPFVLITLLLGCSDGETPTPPDDGSTADISQQNDLPNVTPDTSTDLGHDGTTTTDGSVSQDATPKDLETQGAVLVQVVMGTSRTTEGGGCYREDSSGCDLVTFHLNTTTAEMTDVKVLTSAPDGPEWFPAWSPDGSYVAYNKGTDPGNEQSVQVINVETEASWLALEDARYPAWSPDGDEILVARNLPPRKELTVLSVNTSGPAPTFGDNGYLTEEPMTQDGVVGDPYYIPNSDMIVYHYKTEGDPGSSTWVMDRSTGTTTDLSGPITCGHAAVRPDGQEVACGLAKNDQILSSQRDGVTFGEMSPLFDTPSPAQYATHYAGYADCDWVSNSYFEWCGSNDVIIASAQCAVHDGPKGVMLFSRVFLLQLNGPNEVPTLFDLTARLEEEFEETGLTSASASCRVISGALSP